jgi:hypothetical protein
MTIEHFRTLLKMIIESDQLKSWEMAATVLELINEYETKKLITDAKNDYSKNR